MKMKCVSIDLDGTLLDSNHQISDEDRTTIKSLKDNGIEIIINTGRQHPDVIKIPGVQELECPIFCLNGSMMYSESGELLYETTLHTSLYKKLLATLQELKVGILVYTNQGGFPATLPQLKGKSIEEIQTMFAEQDYNRILELEDIKIYKMIAWVEEEHIEKIAKVKSEIMKISEIAFSSSFPNNVEITSIEAQKGKAIRRYEEIRNYTFDEIISFGDGGNDLSQFEVSTISFAMENAPEAIKRGASHTTKSNNDSGVSYALKHILKIVK